MRVTVIGGGHGCYAAAADLHEKGHEVRWWRRDAEASAALAKAGGWRSPTIAAPAASPSATAPANCGWRANCATRSRTPS